MKKMNTKTILNWRKVGATGLLAAGLALFSMGNSYGQVLVSTDFTGQTLPTGWSNIEVTNDGEWEFDNPGYWSISNTSETNFDSDFAIFDSDWWCGSDEDAELESPSFDVSTTTGGVFLSFDNCFRDYSYGSSEAHVEVWNGTTWTDVLTMSGSSDGYPDANHKMIDITTACGGSSSAKIRFHWMNGACDYYWAIDNVTVQIITCPSPGNLTASSISPTGATISWSTPATGAPGIGYQYYYNTTGTAPTASTPATASTTDTSVSFTTLSPSTQYYFWARSVCSATDTSEWTSSPLIFRTPQIPATLPYTDTFTSTGGSWSFINDGQTNQWVFGSATGNPGSSMYVSDNGGTSNTYDNTSSSIVQAYRDVVLTAGTNPFNFSFDWKCGGEGTAWDYFRVWIVPTTFEPTAGTQISASSSGGVQLGGNFNDPTSGTSWFSDHYIIPNTYAGDTVRIVFEWKNDGSSGIDPPVAIDNVNISVITCATPTNLNATNLTSNSATLTWDSLPTTPGNGYQYYYNTTGVAPTASTTATGSATDTFANLSSLAPNTLYYAWVRSMCSSTDTSFWSAIPLEFKTFCTVDTAPWTYDVETATPTTSSDIEDCWSSDATGSFKWNIDGSGSTPSTSTGPSGAHSGNNYFYTEASSGSQGDSAFLVSPLVDISALNLGALKFYYHMYGQTMGNLYVQVSSNGGTTWNTVDSIIGEQQTSENDPWLERAIILSGYTGTISVRFVGVRGSNYYGDMSLDDISIVEAPTCIAPSGLDVQNILTTSADINWNVPFIVPGTGYEYYYNTSGTAPGVSTAATGSATDTFASLSSLAQNTTYYVWVRSVCSSTDQSDWSAPALIFTTLCSTANVPYTVPMTTGTPSATPPGLPDCMSDEALNPNDNEGWYTASGSPGSTNGFSGNYLRSDYTGSGDGSVNNWVYTNKINMTAGTYYKLSFKYGNNSSSYTEKLAVAYGRAATADSMSTPIFDDTTISFAGSQDTNVYFMAPTTDAYYIGFHAHSDENQYDLFLSNISVDSMPNCYVANSLIANNITTSSANLAWFGTALQYNIEYGPTGFTQGSGTVVTTTSGTYQLANLTPNTTYDFYVEDVCLPGAITAGWSTAGTFTTLCDTPAVSVGHDTAFCTGGAIVLYTGNSDTGRTVVWSDGSSADSLVINASGNYYVTITNQYGCSAADSVQINVKTYPVINLGNDTTICTGNTVTLDAGTQPFGTTFFWNTTQTSQTIQVSDSGQYKVVADNKGCVSSDSIHISEIAAPSVNGITITQNSDGSYSYSTSGVQNNTGLDWDFGDSSPHSSDPNPTHTYINTGNYTVTLVVSNACGSDSATANIRFIAAGIHQITLNNNQLKVYPNPARDQVTLKNESQYKMESVSVYNVLGQEVFHGNTNNQSEYELNVQGLASGMYNIKINFKDGNWISRKFDIRK